ncbi:hypothetical protein BDV28DRAFT_103318 [Aspergillus coremiiformis]|uniref:Uncharacterized protein n=1 Tax=Aspergillus coremiiformis TaxID=138285 RepID=A0A5N6ZI90_9EURO|nr:hypothetical protein BDV28DRAFT_103318 [Aspergillus coremiiformis]
MRWSVADFSPTRHSGGVGTLTFFLFFFFCSCFPPPLLFSVFLMCADLRYSHGLPVNAVYSLYTICLPCQQKNQQLPPPKKRTSKHAG